VLKYPSFAALFVTCSFNSRPVSATASRIAGLTARSCARSKVSLYFRGRV
jgi:hypothetical protein